MPCIKDCYIFDVIIVDRGVGLVIEKGESGCWIYFSGYQELKYYRDRTFVAKIIKNITDEIK